MVSLEIREQTDPHDACCSVTAACCSVTAACCSVTAVCGEMFANQKFWFAAPKVEREQADGPAAPLRSAASSRVRTHTITE